MRRRRESGQDELAIARKKKRARIVAGRFGLLLLLGVSVWLVVFLWEDISRLSLGMRFSDIVASYSPGSGYPVDLPDESTLQMEPMGKDVAILSDVSLSLFNSTAKETLRVVHGYKNPICRTNGDRVLMFDREGEHLKLYSRTDEIWSYTTTHSIVWADISRSGRVAIVSGGEHFQRHVVVFDEHQEEMFLWETSQLVGQVVLNSRGEGMAALSVTADGGVLSSVVTLLDFESEQPIGELFLNDQLVMSAAYVGSQEDKLQIITDKSVYVYNLSGEVLHTYSFGNRILNRFVNVSGDDGWVYVLLDEVGDGRHLTLISLDAQLGVMEEIPIDSGVRDMKNAKNGICIFTDSGVNYYNRETKDNYNFDLQGVEALLPTADSLYTVQTGRLDRHDIN